jgi:hypothetical protein
LRQAMGRVLAVDDGRSLFVGGIGGHATHPLFGY